MGRTELEQALIDEALELPATQRYSLACMLWDSLEGKDSTESLTEAEKAMITARMADFDTHPEKMIPWEEAKTILSKHLR